ncbi:MAG: hypothetical protein QXL01_00870 [Thermoplasmatales archaeon]
MKVKELIKELQELNPEADISFIMNEGCCGDTMSIDPPYDIYGSEYKDKNGKIEYYVSMCFRALPHFKTCRRAGGMNDLLKKFEGKNEN